MNNKIIYIFYPSFENGGIAKILVKLTNFLLKKKFTIKLYCQNVSKRKFINSNKLSIINIKKQHQPNKSYLNKIFLTFLIAKKMFTDLLNEKKKIIIISMQDHIMSLVVKIFLRKKIIIRNSEEINGATKYSDNRILAKINLIIKKILYQFADTIIVNSTRSRKSMKSIINNEDRVKLIFNPYIEKVLPQLKKKKLIKSLLSFQLED